VEKDGLSCPTKKQTRSTGILPGGMLKKVRPICYGPVTLVTDTQLQEKELCVNLIEHTIERRRGPRQTGKAETGFLAGGGGRNMRGGGGKGKSVENTGHRACEGGCVPFQG